MIEDLEAIPAADVVLLHGCCHNPTGIDPTPEQWQKIADVLEQRKLLPLVDFAYQGFATGTKEDAQGLKQICDRCNDLLIASSFSKNFGLYRERVGALTAMADEANSAASVMSQLKRCVRANYSNPPSHGAAIVTTILQDMELKHGWEQELASMRERINDMRVLLAHKLGTHGSKHDFSFMTKQKGMFSFLGLNSAQVDQLREEFSIYMVRSGRINVAGVTEENVDRLAQAIVEVEGETS